MAHLIEYRKVSDTYVPLYFKFSTVSTKHNLTSDKYMSLENWLNIFDQVDEIIANGYSSSSSNSKRSKSFEIENGRLTVKVRWVKTSDSADLGGHILKVLNLSSNVGKYFLKIDVKLSSYFERLFAQLKEKSKSVEGKNQVKESNHEEPVAVKPENVNGNNDQGESTEVVPKYDEKKYGERPTTYGRYEDLVLHETSVEEYIPTPVPTPSAASSFKTTVTPTYHPEKNYAQIEMNQIQSEYSPTYVNSQHKTPNAELDKSTEELTYRPSTRKKNSSESDELKKSHSKKQRFRGRSRELFGTSDEDDIPERVSSSSTSHKSKRKKESPHKKETKSHTPKSTKKKADDPRTSQDSTQDINDISIRNLMNEPVEDILATFPEHESHLKELYDKHSKQLKRNYKPTDIPDMAALDIVTSNQFQKMVDFLEKKLVRNLEEEHNYSDVIFDSILPEWAMAVFCKKYHYSRQEALKRLQLQNIAMNNRSDSELFGV